MLQLYGIIIEEDAEFRLRAAWFNGAQSYFGGAGAQHPEGAR